MMLIILTTLSIISSFVFCAYCWKISGLKTKNSMYLGLLCVGIGSMFAVMHISALASDDVAQMVCAIIIFSWTIKSKILHNELIYLSIQSNSNFKKPIL